MYLHQPYFLLWSFRFHRYVFAVNCSSSKAVVGGPPLVSNEVVQDLKHNIYKLEEEVFKLYTSEKTYCTCYLTRQVIECSSSSTTEWALETALLSNMICFYNNRDCSVNFRYTFGNAALGNSCADFHGLTDKRHYPSRLIICLLILFHICELKDVCCLRQGFSKKNL